MRAALGLRSTVPMPLGSGDGVKTSTSGLLLPPLPLLSSPPTMTTRPSGSRVRVGYQRPSRMSGCLVQVSVNGLNVSTTSSPRKSVPVPE